MSRRLLARTDRPAAFAFLVIAVVLGVGCASVDPRPFAAFSESVKQVRSGADAALQYNYEESRNRLIEEVAVAAEQADGMDTLRSLMLRVNPEEPLMLDPERIPAFLEGRWFREAVFALNSSLVDYGALLHQLSLPERIPREKFERVARELDANVLSALGALGVQEVDPRQVALFSTAASELTRAALERRRRSHLANAIRDNQAAIDVIASHGRDAVQIAAVEMAENYRERSQEILRSLVAGSGSRRQSAANLVQLDEEYIARLATLATLDQAYAALPQAHRELRSAASNPGISLEAIGALHQEGKRLQRLYAELAGGSPTRP